MTKHRLTPEQREALELLASDPQGATEDLLVLAHGFDSNMIAGLVYSGLAMAQRENMKAGVDQSRSSGSGSRARGGTLSSLKANAPSRALAIPVAYYFRRALFSTNARRTPASLNCCATSSVAVVMYLSISWYVLCPDGSGSMP